LKYDFSAKNFEDFCKVNNLSEKKGIDIVLQRIRFLLGEIEKYGT